MYMSASSQMKFACSPIQKGSINSSALALFSSLAFTLNVYFPSDKLLISTLNSQLFESQVPVMGDSEKSCIKVALIVFGFA